MRPHSIEVFESPLYAMNRLRDLSNLLGISPSALNRLRSDVNYREWVQRKPGRKPRLIEEPHNDLAYGQRRIQALFAEIATPDWLKSGKRGIRPIDNATEHSNHPYVANVDIESFFQSTKREFLFKALQHEFQIAPNVASTMADILTYKGHIPTGTSTSQFSAFWAYKASFDTIFHLSRVTDVTMSLWVDDITFSSDKPISEDWIKTVNNVLRKVDLRLKAKKTKRYNSREFKVVTGIAISPSGEFRVKNAKRKEILDILDGRAVENLSHKETLSLLGKLSAQRQIEPAFFDSMHRRCKYHLRQLTRG